MLMDKEKNLETLEIALQFKRNWILIVELINWLIIELIVEFTKLYYLRFHFSFHGHHSQRSFKMHLSEASMVAQQVPAILAGTHMCASLSSSCSISQRVPSLWTERGAEDGSTPSAFAPTWVTPSRLLAPASDCFSSGIFAIWGVNQRWKI